MGNVINITHQHDIDDEHLDVHEFIDDDDELKQHDEDELINFVDKMVHDQKALDDELDGIEDIDDLMMRIMDDDDEVDISVVLLDDQHTLDVEHDKMRVDKHL